jgi:hypothetical protein
MKGLLEFGDFSRLGIRQVMLLANVVFQIE